MSASVAIALDYIIRLHDTILLANEYTVHDSAV